MRESFAESRRIIEENLKPFGEQITRFVEKRASCLGDMAEVLWDEAGEDVIFFNDPLFIERYRSLISLTLPASCGGAVSDSRIDTVGRTVSVVERAYLCCRICDLAGVTGIKGAETFFEESVPSDHPVVCYSRATGGDRAYARLSSAEKSFRPMPERDLTALCEKVKEGLADYCLLPIYHSADGRLSGFCRLAADAGLKVVSLLPAYVGRGGETVFALMGTRVTVPDAPRHCHFAMRMPGQYDLSLLLLAADACGMVLSRVYAVDAASGSYDLCFDVNDKGFCGFLCFCCLEVPGWQPLGIFDGTRE